MEKLRRLKDIKHRKAKMNRKIQLFRKANEEIN